MARVSVNGRSFCIAEKGGAVRAAEAVIQILLRGYPEVEFTVHVPRGGASFVEHWQGWGQIKIDEWGIRCSGAAQKLVWEQCVLPWRVARAQSSLLLSLVNAGPVVTPVGLEQVKLVHDVGFLNREWFRGGFGRYLGLQLALGAHAGTTHVTISEFSASEMKRTAGVSCKRIIPPPLPWLDDEVPEQSAVADSPYLLFVGSLNPRKNIGGLLEAFSLLREARAGKIRLKVAGAAKAIFRGGSPEEVDGVDWLGFVSEEEKAALLNGCEALVMPSFYEGFGLPILEAMRFGRPVFASDLAVFRELFGSRLHYFDPRKPAEMARVLETWIGAEGRYRGDAPDYSEIVERFSPERVASAWCAFFAECLERNQ